MRYDEKPSDTNTKAAAEMRMLCSVRCPEIMMMIVDCCATTAGDG